MSDMSRINPEDVQRAGYCLAGSKKWFERHEIDFRTFIREGVAVDKLPADDAMVQHVLKVKQRG